MRHSAGAQEKQRGGDDEGARDGRLAKLESGGAGLTCGSPR